MLLVLPSSSWLAATLCCLCTENAAVNSGNLQRTCDKSPAQVLIKKKHHTQLKMLYIRHICKNVPQSPVNMSMLLGLTHPTPVIALTVFSLKSGPMGEMGPALSPMGRISFHLPLDKCWSCGEQRWTLQNTCVWSRALRCVLMEAIPAFLGPDPKALITGSTRWLKVS